MHTNKYLDRRSGLIEQINRRMFRVENRHPNDRLPYSSEEYEDDLTRLLEWMFPHAVLPGIRIFSPELLNRDYGCEMDNLVHLRLDGYDYIVIVEAKKQSVQVSNGGWFTTYRGERKDVLEQVDRHVRTMAEYLRPLSRDMQLKFVCYVASSDTQTQHRSETIYRNTDVYLCSFADLPDILDDHFNLPRDGGQPPPEVMRVAQSTLLNTLRLGLPVPQLGHPEVTSAVRYVERCRRSLDQSLVDQFRPTPERWAINGSAGMGKSVLLGYAAAVLCSGYTLSYSLGEPTVKSANYLKGIGFNPTSQRGLVVVMAMSTKQLKNVENWYGFFAEQLRDGRVGEAISFRKPEFIQCRSADSFLRAKYWAALLIDEAHDLKAYAEREIAESYRKGGMYLVVACDRHQKLRHVAANAKIIDGLNFTNKSVRLRRVYRNPAPVYMASLALMFRWFAQDGPKKSRVLRS